MTPATRSSSHQLLATSWPWDFPAGSFSASCFVGQPWNDSERAKIPGDWIE